jgi:hypothetical protein
MRYPSAWLCSSVRVSHPVSLSVSRQPLHTPELILGLGAFGGLIAFGQNKRLLLETGSNVELTALRRTGVAHIKSHLATWRILFLIEGLPSIVLAVVVYFYLPSRPDKSKFLNDRERFVVQSRLNSDSLVESHTGIDWRGVKRAFTDWKALLMAVSSGLRVSTRRS